MRKGNSQYDRLHTGVQTSTVTSTPVEVANYLTIVAYLNVTAVSGTTPTLNIKLQDSADGVTYYDIPGATFTAVTATGQQRIVVTNPGIYLQAVQTIAGTTPSFTYNLDVVGLD